MNLEDKVGSGAKRFLISETTKNKVLSCSPVKKAKHRNIGFIQYTDAEKSQI